MTQAITPQSDWDFTYFHEVRTVIEEKLIDHSHDDDFPLVPQRIVSVVRNAVPNDGILCLDNGMYKLWFARYYEAREQNTILLDNALATMGAGLPSAMGARLVYPDRKIVAIAGDGGFMMNSQDLETAVREKMHIVILILNDSGYGMIKWKQEGMGLEDYGLDFGNPDFVQYAESYGAKGYRVKSAEDFERTLAACLEESAVHLIEVPIDYTENHRVFHEELNNKSCPA